MVLTIQQVADRWGVSRQAVSREIKEGKLKAFTIGNTNKPRYRIRKEWVEEYEENNKFHKL